MAQDPWGEGLPCKNPSCKSHGEPHPNCRCYGGLAMGGEVKPFCETSQPHEKGCQYFADGGEVQADPEAPAPADDTEAPAPQNPNLAPADKQQAIRDYLQQKYAKAADMSGVQAARAKEQQGIQDANGQHGISEMLTAGRAAVGGAGASEEDYKTQLGQAHLPVQQAEEDRKNAIADFLGGNDVARQSDADIQKTKEWKVANDLNDPTSQKSQMAVRLFKSQNPGAVDQNGNIKGMSDEEEGQLTANDIGKQALPNLETNAKLQALKEQAAMRMQYQQQVLTAKKDAASLAQARKEGVSAAKFLDPMSAGGGTELGKAQSKVNNADRVMGSVDIDSTDPEQIDLIRKSRSDPAVAAQFVQRMNPKTNQQYAEIVAGLMSTISPGQGSLGQFEHLKADTFEQTKANLLQKFGNKPVPADAGAFILNNLQTLVNERDISQHKLDDHANHVRAAHPNFFSNPDTAPQAEAMVNDFQSKSKAMNPSYDAKAPKGPAGGGHTAKAGDVVSVRGKTYKVGADGNSLEPQSAVVGN